MTWADLAHQVASIEPPTTHQATISIESATIVFAALERQQAIVFGPEPIKPMPLNFALGVYSSGSTAEPRLICHRSEALIAHAHASAASLGSLGDDRWLVALPLAHVSGLGPLIRALVYRRSVALLKKFEVATFVGAVAEHRITLTSVVPTMLTRLVEANWRPPTHLRHVLVGGAVCPEGLRDRAISLGIPVATTYGMTETFSHVAINGSVLEGVEARTSDDGRLYIRAPSSTVWPEWLATGDRATVNNRSLAIHGRFDDVIISGGENVSPSKVAAVLESHPEIHAALVLGVPDPVWGQRVVAAIAAKPTLDLARVEELIRSRLPAHERPRDLRRLSALPMLPSGKPDRLAISALFKIPVDRDQPH